MYIFARKVKTKINKTNLQKKVLERLKFKVGIFKKLKTKYINFINSIFYIYKSSISLTNFINFY